MGKEFSYFILDLVVHSIKVLLMVKIIRVYRVHSLLNLLGLELKHKLSINKHFPIEYNVHENIFIIYC